MRVEQNIVDRLARHDPTGNADHDTLHAVAIAIRDLPLERIEAALEKGLAAYRRERTLTDARFDVRQARSVGAGLLRALDAAVAFHEEHTRNTLVHLPDCSHISLAKFYTDIRHLVR